HDPNEMVDIPDDIDLVDYDEEDPEEDLEEEPEEEPEKDVDIKLEDDAELIFPYEVKGEKTPPPGDVSSDSELEDEEVDVEPEATIGTTTQKPYAIRDFLRGLFEVGESSSARDSSHVDGLTPWALSRGVNDPSRAEYCQARARLEYKNLSSKLDSSLAELYISSSSSTRHINSSSKIDSSSIISTYHARTR
ncbi:hypothetical protein Tco_0288724, partial [Tanacetum coccineum]